jgi:hypothetical protein
MKADPTEYFNWSGLWIGQVEPPDVPLEDHSKRPKPEPIRLEVARAIEGTALCLDFEFYAPGRKALWQVARIMVISDGLGGARAVCYASGRGPMLLQMLPDDEGVLALSGESIEGGRISLTLFEEAPDMLVLSTSYVDTASADNMSEVDTRPERSVGKLRRCRVSDFLRLPAQRLS